MIAGVTIAPLKIIADHRGSVMHMLRSDAPTFAGFGEVYFSTVNAGVVKGWKRHRRMVMSVAVPAGRLRFVMHDDRPDSPTNGKVQVVEMGPEHNYCLVTVPPLVWTAFQGMGPGPALLANLASIPHDPAEADTRPLDECAAAFAWPAIEG